MNIGDVVIVSEYDHIANQYNNFYVIVTHLNDGTGRFEGDYKFINKDGSLKDEEDKKSHSGFKMKDINRHYCCPTDLGI